MLKKSLPEVRLVLMPLDFSSPFLTASDESQAIKFADRLLQTLEQK